MYFARLFFSNPRSLCFWPVKLTLIWPFRWSETSQFATFLLTLSMFETLPFQHIPRLHRCVRKQTIWGQSNSCSMNHLSFSKSILQARSVYGWAHMLLDENGHGPFKHWAGYDLLYNSIQEFIPFWSSEKHSDITSSAVRRLIVDWLDNDLLAEPSGCWLYSVQGSTVAELEHADSFFLI